MAGESSLIKSLLQNLSKQRPDAMKRARAMGFDTRNVYFHGTDQPIESFNPNVYVAKDPLIAEGYARKREYDPVQLDLFKPNPSPNIMPMFAKKGEVEQTNKLANYYKVFDPRSLRSVFAEFNPEHAESVDIMKSHGGSAKSPAWTRSEGKNPEGGLNEKGRASLKAAGHDIKRPQPEGGARKDSFCARMKGMKAKLTSSETANDPDSRINKSLRKWKCRADGGALDVARQYKAGGGEIYLLKQKLAEMREGSRKEKNLKTRTPPSKSLTTPYGTSPTTPNISKDLYEKGNLGDDNYALAKGGVAKAASKVARRYRAFGGTDVPPVNPAKNVAVAPSAQSIPQANNAAPNNVMMAPAYKQYSTDINNAYKTYLGREGDAEGLQHWGEQIHAGNADLGNLRDTFLSSQEGKNYAKSNPNQLVQALYQQSLGRPSDEAGANYWAQQLSQGMSPQDIYNTFAGTQEAENYNAINEIYRQNLGRDVDQEGLKYWSDMMSKGNIDPEALGQIVSGSQEAKNYDNTEFIKDEYSGLLGKEPSQEELSKALADLNSGKVTYEDFDNNLSKSEASQLYQASNFEPYDVAAKGSVAFNTGKARTAFQSSKSVPRTSEELNNIFAPIEEKYGLAPGSMIGKMGLESTWGQNPRAYKTNATYKGPFQLSKDIIRKYNVKNPFDLNEAASAAAQYERDNAKEFEQKVGRKPLPHEGYNMHQQGLTGYSTLAKNPGMKAVDALKTIMKSKKASNSIRQNMPPSLQGKVTYKDVTAQQFMDGWKVEFDKKLAGPDGKGQTPVVASDKGVTPKEDPALAKPFQPGSQPLGDEISQQEFLQDQGIGGTMVPPGTTMFPITDISGGGYQDPGQYGGNYTDVISGVTPPTVPHTVTHHPVTHTPVTHVGGGSHPSSGDHGSFGVSYAPDTGYVVAPGVYSTDPNGKVYSPITGRPYGDDDYSYDQTRAGSKTGGAVKNAMDVARAYKKGGPVWDKPRPKSLGKPTPLTSGQKSSAKAAAKAAGRPYPNLVDNMRAAKKD
jgi:hypothetical protein